MSFGWLVLLCLIKVSIGLDCTQYTSETECNAQTPSCLWQTNACQCAAETKLDIYFGIDKSSSITPKGFEVERQFLISLANGVLPLDKTRMGFIEFSTYSSVIHSLQYWTQSSLTTYFERIYYSGGYTNTRQELQQVVSEFTTYNDPTRSNVHILVTDGNPYSSSGPVDVCWLASSVKNADIRVVLMLVGPDINEANLDCLTADPYSNPNPDIIRVKDFTPNSFASILPQLANIVCPVSYDLTITEVGPVTSSNAPGGYDSRFVEFYNPGIDIPLSSIVGTGFIQTTDTSAGLGSATIATNTYAVFYDSDITGVTCNHPIKQCDCTLRTNNIWCSTSEATYIPCCASGCVCSFDNSMTKDSWSVAFSDNSDSSTLVEIDSVTRDSTFPIVSEGYKYELIDKTFPNDIGSNWKASCYITGTPGADPIDGCTSCDNTDNGPCLITNGTCNSNTGICDCTTGYYTTNQSCIEIPPPTNCIVTILKDYEINPLGIERAVFEWEAPITSIDKRYVLTVPNIDNTATLTFTTYSRTQSLPNTDYQQNLLSNLLYGTIQTEIPPGSGDFSVKVDCVVYTAPPSPAPTAAPTSAPTDAPTNAPTGSPIIAPRIGFLESGSCSVDRCECNGKSLLCCIDDATWNTTECSVNENENAVELFQRTDPWPFNVKIKPPTYVFDIIIHWNIEWIYDRYVNVFDGSTSTSNTTADPTPSVMITPLSGNVTYTEALAITSGKVPILLTVIDGILRRRRVLDVNTDNFNIFSIYKLSLIDCVPSSDEANCTIVYPTQQYISLEYGRRANLKTEKNIKPWVLPLVFGLLGFALILGILLWAIWRMNARKTKQVDDNYGKLDDAYKELDGNLEDQMNVGDINANALATGVPGLQANKQDFDNHIKERAKNNNEFAHQDAHKFNERQQIGQVQGNSNVYQPPQNI